MSSKSSSPRLSLWLVIAAIVILLDQIAKVVVVRTLAFGASHYVTGVFNLVHAHNVGAAFSFLAQAGGWQRWFFVGLALAAAIFIVLMLRRHAGQTLFALALTLILGGALGNVIDRLIHGFVIDFIQVHWHDAYFPAFNLADSAITLGAMLLIFDELKRVRRS